MTATRNEHRTLARVDRRRRPETLPEQDARPRRPRAQPRSVALGWDIAIADSGCVILDGNPNWGPGWQPCAPEGVRALLARLYPDDF
ncbi:MAG TPA: hypothetical protein VFO62_10150 [Candidatus Binatia bacterium]|nr:hypothetical protein [Candidatus Binatia bacterium]